LPSESLGVLYGFDKKEVALIEAALMRAVV